MKSMSPPPPQGPTVIIVAGKKHIAHTFRVTKEIEREDKKANKRGGTGAGFDASEGAGRQNLGPHNTQLVSLNEQKAKEQADFVYGGSTHTWGNRSPMEAGWRADQNKSTHSKAGGQEEAETRTRTRRQGDKPNVLGGRHD